jgi:hypothetical protein
MSRTERQKDMRCTERPDVKLDLRGLASGRRGRCSVTRFQKRVGRVDHLDLSSPCSLFFFTFTVSSI